MLFSLLHFSPCAGRALSTSSIHPSATGGQVVVIQEPLSGALGLSQQTRGGVYRQRGKEAERYRPASLEKKVPAEQARQAGKQHMSRQS
eukprot:107559-Rhodomonas_salina.2